MRSVTSGRAASSPTFSSRASPRSVGRPTPKFTSKSESATRSAMRSYKRQTHSCTRKSWKRNRRGMEISELQTLIFSRKSSKQIRGYTTRLRLTKSSLPSVHGKSIIFLKMRKILSPNSWLSIRTLDHPPPMLWIMHGSQRRSSKKITMPVSMHSKTWLNSMQVKPWNRPHMP